MARKKTGTTPPDGGLSVLALILLRSMAESPNRIEYNTRVLGDGFTDDTLASLDEAYHDLAERGLVERTRMGVMFFGTFKALYRISESGRRLVENGQ